MARATRLRCAHSLDVHRCPHLHRDCARPRPHLHRDCARPCHARPAQLTQPLARSREVYSCDHCSAPTCKHAHAPMCARWAWLGLAEHRQQRGNELGSRPSHVHTHACMLACCMLACCRRATSQQRARPSSPSSRTRHQRHPPRMGLPRRPRRCKARRSHPGFPIASAFAPCHVCAGTGLTPAASAPGLGSPHATSARGLGSPQWRLRWDWAQPAASAPGLGSPHAHVCAGTGLSPRRLRRDGGCLCVQFLANALERAGPRSGVDGIALTGRARRPIVYERNAYKPCSSPARAAAQVR